MVLFLCHIVCVQANEASGWLVTILFTRLCEHNAHFNAFWDIRITEDMESYILPWYEKRSMNILISVSLKRDSHRLQ